VPVVTPSCNETRGTPRLPAQRSECSPGRPRPPPRTVLYQRRRGVSVEMMLTATAPDRPTSVRNKLFGGFARFQAEASFWGLVRSGSRSDSFRGPGRAECTEMHYSPGNLTRKGAGLPLLLLLFTLASRPVLRSPGPGLSFRGIAQWSPADPGRDLA
jgi:hypothetical protein